MSNTLRNLEVSTVHLGFALLTIVGFGVSAANPTTQDDYQFSHTSLILTDDQEEYALLPYLEILADPNQEFTFEEISDPNFAQKFTSASEYNFSLSFSAYWLRLNLTNQADPHKAWLLIYDNYRINQISAYIPDPERGGYQEIHTGNAFPFSSRDYNYHNFVFQFDFPSDTPQTIYLYLFDVGGVSLDPLKIKSLSSFSQEGMQEQLWTGAFYFSILIIALYTIFFIFSLNDPTLLSFLLVLIAVCLTSLSADGIGHQYLWPNWTIWAKVSISTSILLYVAALLNYSLVSLKTHNHFPHLARLAYFMIGALFVLLVVRLNPNINSIPLNIIFVIILLLGLGYPIFLAFRSLKVERQQARIFLLAFTAYLVVIIVSVFENAIGKSVNMTMLSRLAFLWLLLVFSISTNLRINRIRRERIMAQEQLLSEQHEALQLQTQLADTLRKSRDDILEAYDTTLEGWALLLELRDKETEGHSRNVVDLTLRFAEHLGIPADERIHIRRGSLLHDIGKIAIPDSILLKPDRLTEDEWQVMHQHPLFALKFLSTIPYLEKAIDIPAYHHENWDGTGYAQQLSGESIPLAARLFALVDNWDALLSDRPYRDAWSREKTIQYIQDQSGKKFDPHLVKAFLELVGA